MQKITRYMPFTVSARTVPIPCALASVQISVSVTSLDEVSKNKNGGQKFL